MSLLGRTFRLFTWLTLAAVSAALPTQTQAQSQAQFLQPEVELTGGRVAAIVPGSFQPSGLTDLLYLNSLTVDGVNLSVTAGQLLNRQGFTNLVQNQVTFTGVLNVVAAAADLDADNHVDFAFALSPTSPSAPDLCVYYGTGADINAGPTIYPIGQRSGCMTLSNTTRELPSFRSMAAAPFNNGGVPQLFLVDSANLVIDVIGNDLSPSNGGTLTGFHVASQLPIPAADGAGPILLADINNDGHTDLLLNNQGSLSVSIYLGNGDGTFQAPLRIHAGDARSMLLHDLDGDGIPDLVLENASGAIQFFHGNNSGPIPFATSSSGGTEPGVPPESGAGGQLVAIGDLNRDGIPDILTATPAGLSVLLGEPGQSSGGAHSFRLAGIYNIGPGRNAFALADFDGDGFLDLAVDSPTGVAIIPGNGDGTFHTAPAFATGLPALSAAVADFNGDHKPDIAVSTGINQAAILLGDGNGTFQPFASSNGAPVFNTALWSSIFAGDLNGDGRQDLLFATTGLPLPTSGSGLQLQFGNGDGTFAPPQTPAQLGLAAPADNTFYGAAALADLNGDGLLDIASIDATYYDTLFSSAGHGFTLGLNFSEDANLIDSDDLDSFSQVAAGYLAAHHTSGPQDLVFQDDNNLIPYLNSGDGANFTRMASVPGTPDSTLYYENTVLIADIDGDGNGDLIVPYHNLGSDPGHPSPSAPNQLYVWYGNGDGTFASPVVTNLSRNFYLAQLADMNNDGRPDLVLSDGFLVAILYNQGNRLFGNEQDLLAGEGINSISVADVNGDGSLDLVLANGGATISAPVAMGLLTNNSLALTPNPAPNNGGVTVLLNAITTRPVTGSITATPNPAKYQAGITLTASFTPAIGVPLPTGTVQFAINGTALGSPVAVTPGTAAVSATYAIPSGNSYSGTPTFSAQYSGDARNSPLTVYTTDAISGSATETTLALCVGPTPACPSDGLVQPPYIASLTMSYGQTFNGTAAAQATDGSALDPASTIGFYDSFNGAPPILLCTLGISYGSSCPPSVGTTLGTGVGTHVFTAVYAGDATHSGSTSPAVTIRVLPDTTTAALTSSVNPAAQSQPVTFTATLAGSIAAPVGVVTFLDGTSVIGTGALVPSATGSSRATLTTSTLAPGTHPITVSYPGTQNFLPATSAVLNQVIAPVLATTSRLTSAPNPSYAGQAVTFTDTVSLANGAASPVPTGVVTFSDGATILGTGPLNAAGVATFTTATLAPGTHTITATSSGDSASGASSATVTQVVNALPPPGSVNFSIGATPNPASLGVGNSVAITVTVKPLTSFATPVNLACSNLPYEVTCSFGSTQIPAGGGSTVVLISAMAPHSCGSSTPYFVAGSGPGPGHAPLSVPAIAALSFLALPGRRRWLRCLLALAAITAALQITGCGTCTDLGTRPGTYTVQLAGSASGGTSEVESTPVVLNVHL